MPIRRMPLPYRFLLIFGMRGGGRRECGLARGQSNPCLHRPREVLPELPA